MPASTFASSFRHTPSTLCCTALRESAQLWATGDRQRAIHHLEEARRGAPHSAALVAQLIDYAAALGDMARAQAVFAEVEADASLIGRHLAYLALARAYLDGQMVNEARGAPGQGAQAHRHAGCLGVGRPLQALRSAWQGPSVLRRRLSGTAKQRQGRA